MNEPAKYEVRVDPATGRSRPEMWLRWGKVQWTLAELEELVEHGAFVDDEGNRYSAIEVAKNHHQGRALLRVVKLTHDGAEWVEYPAAMPDADHVV